MFCFVLFLLFFEAHMSQNISLMSSTMRKSTMFRSKSDSQVLNISYINYTYFSSLFFFFKEAQHKEINLHLYCKVVYVLIFRENLIPSFWFQFEYLLLQILNKAAYQVFFTAILMT